MYKVGDKFEIEIAEVFNSALVNQLYRIKGFNSLVFDKNGLDKLKKVKDYQSEIEKAYADGKMDGYMQGRKEAEEAHKNNAQEPIKNVKASDLAVDTKVLCWNNNDTQKNKRYFAKFKEGKMYAFANATTSWTTTYGQITHWDNMILEDGTVVLEE